MKTFKEFLDEDFIDEEEVDEAIPMRAKHDKSPKARQRRKTAKRMRRQNKGKIRQQQKKRARIMKTPAFKAKKKRADAQGKTMGGSGRPPKRKTTFINKT